MRRLSGRRAITWAGLWATLLFGNPFVSRAAEPTADAAGRIMELWGRERGLCSVVAAGGADVLPLAAALASSRAVAVHVLAADDAAVQRARAAVSERGLDGYVAVEALPLNPLPYRDNLINLMVVPDPASATAAGFSKIDALRAVAPLGVLCTFDHGNWSVTRKPVQPGMDEWTHNIHGPDGNRVSHDTVVRFPFGYRWNAGLPFNINNPERQGNRYSSTRGMAVVGGRCFTFSDSVVENLRGAYFLGQGLDQYVTARDAFSGLLLWRRKIGHVYYGGLWYMNLAPFAATEEALFTVSESGDLLVLEAATGEPIKTIDTTFAPGELLVDQGVLVTATWKGGTWVGESKVNRFERRRMHSAVPSGTVEAYDAASGARLWRREAVATSIRSADGAVFIIQRQGPDLLEESRRYKTAEEKAAAKALAGTGAPAPVPPVRPAQAVVALDLKTGAERWQVAAETLSPQAHDREALRLDAVGLGVVTVIHAEDTRSGRVSVLSAKDGHIVVQASGGFPVLLDGAVHLGGKVYDPVSGKETSRSAYSIGSTVCTPSYVVNEMIVRNRGGAFSVAGKTEVYAGARGSCSMGSVPAYGAFYTPQNWCTCCPPQISGFICFGPVGTVPTEDQMTALSPVVRGPASAELPDVAATDGAAWPMVRGGSARGCATAAPAPTSLGVLWRTEVPSPEATGAVGRTWQEYLNPPLTGPTAAGDIAAFAVMDANQVVGLSLVDGKELWRFTAGSRIDSSPTLYRGVCLFGAHDGYVYAVDARTGDLRWRSRISPRNERLVSYGKVESPWPVIGSVLVADGTAYASAGRTQGSDGGIVVRAFDPLTGKPTWSRALPSAGGIRGLRRNDLLFKVGDAVQMMFTRLDLATGEARPNLTEEVDRYNSSRGRVLRDLARLRNEAKVVDGKAAEAASRKIGELEKRLAGLTAPESEMALSLGARGTGSEGLVHWNWPRLGDRKYRQMNYGNVSGTLVSWDDTAVCTMTRDRNLSLESMADVGKAGEKPTGKHKWAVSLPAGQQVTSLAVCHDAVEASGGSYQTAAEGGVAKGFVTVLSRDTGTTVAQCELPAPVVYSGLAVLDRKVCVALADSSVVLLGQ